MAECEFVGQSVEFVAGCGGTDTIEAAARTCTLTECKDSDDFYRRLPESHTSPREFGWAFLKIVVDRAIQQEVTRHRHFSYNIESTRLIDYRKRKFVFVTKPPKESPEPQAAIDRLEWLCQVCADTYCEMLDLGASRDYARKALVLALASNISMAGDLLCWLQMIPKRLVKAAHPEARDIARKMLGVLKSKFPVVFDRIAA